MKDSEYMVLLAAKAVQTGELNWPLSFYSMLVVICWMPAEDAIGGDNC